MIKHFTSKYSNTYDKARINYNGFNFYIVNINILYYIVK